MPSTYSNLKFQLMATGENNATWGNVTNVNIGTAIEEAIAGTADVSFSSGDVTLTLTNTNTTQTARNLRLNLTGTTGGSTRNLIVPAIEKAYIVNNGCADSIVVKNATGTGVTVPAGKSMWVFNNGTNVVDVTTHLTSMTLGTPLALTQGGTGSNTASGARTNLGATTVGANLFTLPNPSAVRYLQINADNTVTALNASAFVAAIGAGSSNASGTVTSVNIDGSTTGLTFSGGPVTTSGTFTLGGTLGVTAGGTGANTASGARTNLGLGSLAVLSSVNNSNWSGTVLSVANGGTGSNTAADARTALGATTVGSSFFTLPNPSAVRFIQINANNTVSALDAASFLTAIGAGSSNASGTVTSVNLISDVSGLSFSGGPITTFGNITMSGTLALVNGGTGATTAAGARTALELGSLATASTINNGNWSGTQLTVTNGGTGVTSLTANAVVVGNGTSSVTTISPGTTGNVLQSNGTAWLSQALATIDIAGGGTGATTASGARTNLGLGSLAVLNSINNSNWSGTALAAGNGGTGITSPGTTGNVLTSNGSAWVSQAPTAGGTVTSVSGTGTVNGISLTGTVTNSGSLTLGGALTGVNLSTQVAGTLPIGNGGTGGTTVSDARTNLGLGTLATLNTINDSNWSGTVLSVANGGTGANNATSARANLGLGSLSTLNSINNSNWSGTQLAAGNGGTGLTAVGTSGNVLTSNGSAWVSQAPAAVSLTSGVSGILPVANGGTGSNTASGARTNLGVAEGFSQSSTPFITAVGNGAGVGWTGARGVFIGLNAGSGLGSSTDVVLIGNNAGAGINTSTATGCVAIGSAALQSNSASLGNTAVGRDALNLTTGQRNTALGYQAGAVITSGSDNTVVGRNAGGIDSGSNNTVIGSTAAASSTSVSNEITLGNSSIATLRCQVTTITALSDARDKENIHYLDAGLSFVKQLEPVRFTWNMRDGGKVGEEDTGFIAQQLKQVQEQTGITIPGLVYEENPERLEAGYGKLLPVLVKAIQELAAKVEALEAQRGS